MCVLLPLVDPSRREVHDILHLTPSEARSLNITKFLASYSATQAPNHVKRIIRSLEEIEDEDSSGLIKGSEDKETVTDENRIDFSGDYYERSSESMNFRMEVPSGEGDWEGGPIGESGAEQDNDATDDIIQSQTHGVTAVKRTEMVTVIDPRHIEEFETDANNEIVGGLQEDFSSNEPTTEQTSGESDQEQENTWGFSGASGTSGTNITLLDDIQSQNSGDGSGQINTTVMHEVQRNLQKVWRYASSGKNLDMVFKGPKGKEEERKLRQIYNLVIKHESKGTSSSDQGRGKPKETVSGDESGFDDGFTNVLGESGDESDKKHETGSANDSDEKYETGSADFVESHNDEKGRWEANDVSGESSGHIEDLDISEESASGSGNVNKKLMKEVEHNLHQVWRYAAPKKDLDMVARGPKGKEEEEKLKKVYNIVSKHESGSAFLNFELRKQREKSVDDSLQEQKHDHGHKSRKSKVKIAKTTHNATEAKLYRLQKARKYKHNKNLKRLKPWRMGMGKHNSARKPSGMYVKQVGGKGKKETHKDNKLDLLGKEMKELAPTDENDDKVKKKESSKDKSDENETKEMTENQSLKQQTELEQETQSETNKSKGQRIVLDSQDPFDKTRLEVGRKLEEMILSRMAQLETQRLSKKLEGKQAHLKDSKKEEDKEEVGREKPKGRHNLHLVFFF